MEEALTQVCTTVFRSSETLSNLIRLTGGANMETWSFHFGDNALILRRLPVSDNAQGGNSVADLPVESEAAVIQAAEASGVAVPAILHILTPEDGLGRGFIMRKLDGETLPKPVQTRPEFAQARSRFVADCARELAKIHKVPTEGVIETLPLLTPADAVQTLATEFEALGYESPVISLAINWLQNNAPEPPDIPCLIHGDFRLGNLIIKPDGLSAVLDWELAHRGDPAQDLAYLCTPSWRFTHYAAPVGGLGEINDLLDAYASNTGVTIAPARFHFWLVYSSLWWATACLKMSSFWRSGEDRSLERAVIGRRITEAELDLLLLLEPEQARTQPGIQWQPPEAPLFSGATDHSELATALQEWLLNTAAERLTGREKFEARVAHNAAGMILRQLSHHNHFRDLASQRLAAMGFDSASFQLACSNDQVSLEQQAVLQHLRITALERLYIDQPRYPGLQFALKTWGSPPPSDASSI